MHKMVYAFYLCKLFFASLQPLGQAIVRVPIMGLTWHSRWAAQGPSNNYMPKLQTI
jgi:hypothetical protein